VPELVSDRSPEQCARVDVGLFGHPIHAIDVDSRQHTAPSQSADQGIAERQVTARISGGDAGAHDSDREFSRRERCLAATPATSGRGRGCQRWL